MSTDAPPTDADLRSQLGDSYAAWQSLLARNADLRPEWKYYGVRLGWNLKLFHLKRNLCFIVPHQDHFVVGFALGAALVEEALAAPLPDAVKREIAEARTYAEGRGVRVVVREERDLVSAQTLLELKRGPKAGGSR